MARHQVPLPRQSTHTVMGLEWTEQFNCWRTTVAGWLALEFVWNSDGYKMTFAGRELKAKANSPEQAAQLLINCARTHLQKALDALPKPE